MAALISPARGESLVPPTLPDALPASVRVELLVLRDDLALPVSLVALDDGSRRAVVTQLAGTVVLVSADAVRSQPVLDLRHRVTARAGEQGLYSVAIEPAARAHARGGGRMIVAAFTEREHGDLVIAAYPLDDERWVADGQRETQLLRVPIPEPFHHGGQVAFGPDGMLWASIGDGELSPGDTGARPPAAQDLRSLLGSVIRLDPLPLDDRADAAPYAAPYAVPADNPFAAARADDGSPAASEIWAYGFRNPWKFTFHPETGAVLLVDVGSERWEEVNEVQRGGNHGWPWREGRECLVSPGGGLIDPECPERPLVDPIVAMPHVALDPHGARAITGGAVVTDPELDALVGRFVFGDFATGRLWSLDLDDGRIEFLIDTGLPLTHVTTGPGDALLVLAINGVLARVVLAAP